MDGTREASKHGGPLAAGGRASVAVVLALVLSWSGAFVAPAVAAEDGAPPPPLTNEDVVRRFVTGTSETELVAWIRSSPVAFDLSDDMRDELKLAGLPASVLRAMAERQAELAAPDVSAAQAEPATTALSPSGDPLFTLLLNGSDDGAAGAGGDDTADGGDAVEGEQPPTLRVLDVVPPEFVELFGIRDPEPRFTDIAVFLGCRTTDHVPDHWRSETPLGRDFAGTPRHRMLQFVGGAKRTEAGLIGRRQVPVDAPVPVVLELAIPAELTTPLEPEVAHDLTLGIALQVGDRWYLVVRDDRDGIVVPAGGGLRMRGRLSSGPNPRSLELAARFEAAE